MLIIYTFWSLSCINLLLQLSVAFHIKTNSYQTICTANQMTGSSLKCSTNPRWVKLQCVIQQSNMIEILDMVIWIFLWVILANLPKKFFFNAFEKSFFLGLKKEKGMSTRFLFKVFHPNSCLLTSTPDL